MSEGVGVAFLLGEDGRVETPGAWYSSKPVVCIERGEWGQVWHVPGCTYFSGGTLGYMPTRFLVVRVLDEGRGEIVRVFGDDWQRREWQYYRRQAVALWRELSDSAAISAAKEGSDEREA